MSRRNTELLLLVVAAPVVLLLFAMIAMSGGSKVTIATLGVPLGVFLAFVVAHFATRILAREADPAILPLSFALSGIGIGFVTRLAPDLATNQVIWLFLGVACMIGVMAFVQNLDRLAGYKYTLMLVGFLLLLSPLIPGLGQEIYGSRIWLALGPFSFQPGEIAKIVIVLFLAGYLSQNREMLSVFTWKVGPVYLPDARTLLPVLLMWGMALLVVVFEKDLGSALVFFFVFLAMLYAATGKKSYLVIGLLLILVGGVGAYLAFGHVQVRVHTWLNPFADAQDTGYQLVQAIYSMADGGLFGQGIGNGMAENIPVVESDFIFADIAEETGLLGAAGVLLLFLCFAIRGLVVAARARTDVSSLAAAGLTSIIILQAFIIVGGVTRLIPLTGLTLPFVSQGGSSLLASFICVGFLLRCGDDGTGIESEIQSGTTMINSNSVLGRVSVGKRLTHEMFLYGLMFAALVANLTMIMVVLAEHYQSMPGNNHTIAREADTERGTISTYDGTVLAQSTLQDDGSYVRTYPSGTLASHVVGYCSERFGTSGIEASMNDTLQGNQDYASWTDVVNAATGKGVKGNDVALTLNTEIQQAAEAALEGERGACVVMDPTTGAILAMASAPTYDAGYVEDLLTGEDEEANDQGTLINRATQSLYAPGSTFKIISLTTALENGIASEEDVFNSPGEMEIGNASVSNFGNIEYGDITLARATEVSSNTVYGQLGVKMGAQMLVEGAEQFGFDQELDCDLPVKTSLMEEPDNMSAWGTAWACAGEPVGQTGPNATVLEMAMTGCAIANQGVIMKPYLVDSIYSASGERSYTAKPKKLFTACSSKTADRVFTVLEGVVTNGTGYAASIDGATVAGKTGTAEKEDGNDSWFVGVAENDGASVVIAIVIEKGDDEEGAVKAQNVLRTALEVEDAL